MTQICQVARSLRFDDLYSDQEFCTELGRAMLAAGTLETELKAHLANVASVQDTKRHSLGRLLALAKKHNLLTELHRILELLIRQRNSLAHRLYPVPSGVDHDDLLSEPNLIHTDVVLFTERAWQLAANLREVAGLVAKRRSTYEDAC